MKTKRHAKIVELISQNDIETQEELAYLLNEAGYTVTQATVSRDIRELKLGKVSVDGGRQKYVVLRETSKELTDKYCRVLNECFVSMDYAMNILVVKTVAGMAMAVAAAMDQMEWPEIVGCIGGDDTVMCAVRTIEDMTIVMDKINQILN